MFVFVLSYQELHCFERAEVSVDMDKSGVLVCMLL